MGASGLFGSLLNRKKPKQREELKIELREKLTGLQRGLTASPKDKEEVERLAAAVEAANPNRASLSSPLVNGKWRLLYTTSSSILGTSRPPFLRPGGEIFQTIDAVNLKACNQETWPFFNKVTADLTPETGSRVGVQFKQFKLLGLLPVNAPPSAKGKLDITYVDEELRISRGDKGNLFILEMVDPEAKP
ncbi:hypothetical protein WJX81_006618 [Elliptochloris bilobata]|uniref:Plastid lipid-associated protein/fibrillin conserved domain-containing protein n=1 Tax=Elliptochloris bilobata TaxID=381761 RepID=A0AAW1SD37_9CHLO